MNDAKDQNHLDGDFLDACRTGRFEDAVIFLSRGADLEARDAQENGALHLAAQGNAARTMAHLIKSGIALETCNRIGMTPLHMAAWGNHSDGMKVLIEAGMDVSAKDNEGRSPLALAAQGRNNVDRTDTVLLLIAHGANAEDGPLKYRKTTMGQAAVLGKLKERIFEILDRGLSGANEDAAEPLIAYAKASKVPHSNKETLNDMVGVIESQQARSAINSMLNDLQIKASSTKP
jgi:ankyrin repeat protein